MFQDRCTLQANLLPLAPGVGLNHARAHEIAGMSRQFLALLIAAALRGPVLWLSPTWEHERLNGGGVAAYADPSRMIFGAARTEAEMLWAAEEALRAGVVPLVVAELPEPPALTPVRRLHLAAQEGANLGGGPGPLMLLLTPEHGGAPGVETRWHIAPVPAWTQENSPGWRLALLRSRTSPLRDWDRTIHRNRIKIESKRDGAALCGEA